MDNLDIDGLPKISDIIKKYSLSAKKNLGQNFLLDFNLTRKIARLAGANKNLDFLEIGAGPGGLTRALLYEGANSVTIVEKDPRTADILGEISRHYPNRVNIIMGDALDICLDDIMTGRDNYAIAANLPYNISSQILTSWIAAKNWPPKWVSATLMYQREFADRLRAPHGNKDYGRLSILTQWRCEVEKLFDVNPANFTPPPKVTSSVIKIMPKHNIKEVDINALENITRASFGKRRKMLRQSLKDICDDPENLCDMANISSQMRADHLSVDDYLRLANYLKLA